MLTAIFEMHSGPDGKIFDGPRDDDLVRLRNRLYPRGYVDGNASEFAALKLALAGMDVSPYLDAQTANSETHSLRTLKSGGRGIEPGGIRASPRAGNPDGNQSVEPDASPFDWIRISSAMVRG